MSVTILHRNTNLTKNAFPLAPPSDREAFSDYADLLLFDPESLILKGEWFSRSDFDKSKIRDIYIDSNRTGMKASDRHHWYARMACDSLNSPSPIRSWYQEKHRATLENSDFFENSPKTALALRKYIASQFRPTAALAIYRMFNAKSVYDPCGGWGDRLIAAMAGNVDYHCRDVNPLVFAGYAAMEQMYKHKCSISFEYECAEVSSPKGEFDLVFTSPPYWKAEKYQGDYSSFKQHKSFDQWRDGFLLKMLDYSWKVVKPKGHLVINASDIYGGHTYNKIVQPILDHFKDQNPYVIGYKMAKRVNSKSDSTGVFCEPIIVIEKVQ